VAARFADAGPRQWRLAVVHQPAAVLRDQDRADLLHGHDAALRRWSQAGVDLVLGGHIHLPYVIAMHEHDRALPRPLWVVQAGTAVSSRVRHEAGNSVNVLRALDAAAGRRCAIERWDWDAGRAAFGLARRDEVAAGGAAG
jgi:3',5'-cyclic AMP phosphodiesterase CpdA